MLGLTLQIPAHADDAVVVQVQAAQAGELGEALQDEDCIVGEIYAVELVLQHTGGGGFRDLSGNFIAGKIPLPGAPTCMQEAAQMQLRDPALSAPCSFWIPLSANANAAPNELEAVCL